MLCWWDLHPRSPDTGVEFSREDVTTALADRTTVADAVRTIFPIRFVPVDRRVWAADRVLMPMLAEAVSSVSGLLQRRPSGVPHEEWAAVLESHSITPEIEALLLAEDVPAFVEARQVKVVSDLRDFLERRCEWGFENTPDLTGLLLEDLVDDDDDAV